MQELNGCKVKGQSLAEIVVAISIISVCLMIFMRTFSNINSISTTKNTKHAIENLNRSILNQITRERVVLNRGSVIKELLENGWTKYKLKNEYGEFVYERLVYEGYED